MSKINLQDLSYEDLVKYALDLEKQLEERDCENSELSKGQTGKGKKRAAGHQGDFSSLEEEIRELRDKNDNDQLTINKLREDLASSNIAKAELDQKFRVQSKRLEDLERENNNILWKSQNAEKLSEEINKLKTANIIKISQQLTQENDQLKDEVKELTNQKKQLAEEKQQLEELLIKFAEEIAGKLQASVNFLSKTNGYNGVKCPVCLVRNDEMTKKCISCDYVLNPNAKAVAAAPASAAKASPSTSTAAPTADIWAKLSSTEDIKCPVCMMRNRKDAVKCVSCEFVLASTWRALDAITTGDFTIGADSSKSPAPAPVPSANKPPVSGLPFQFQTSTEASEPSSLPDLKPIVTSGSGFIFGVPDKAPSLGVISSVRDYGKPEDGDFAKRAKRKAEEPSPFSITPADNTPFSAENSLYPNTTNPSIPSSLSFGNSATTAGGIPFSTASPHSTPLAGTSVPLSDQRKKYKVVKRNSSLQK